MVAAGGNPTSYQLIWKNETGKCVYAGLMPVNYKDPKQIKTNSSLTLAACEKVGPFTLAFSRCDAGGIIVIKYAIWRRIVPGGKYPCTSRGYGVFRFGHLIWMCGC